MGSTRFKTDNEEQELWINEVCSLFTKKDFVKAMGHEVMVHARRNYFGLR